MGSVNGSIRKMRGLAIVFLSAAAVVRANPCQNDEDVYFPDPEDCGRFYMCVDGSVVGHMSCPDGLLWNTDLLTCDWPRNVECKPGCPGQPRHLLLGQGRHQCQVHQQRR